MVFNLLKQRSSVSSNLDKRLTTQNNSLLESVEYIEIKRYSDGKPVSSELILLSQSTDLEGRAETNISAKKFGRVFYQGTTWQAYCCSSTKISQGQKVLVLERRGLTLWVIST